MNVMVRSGTGENSGLMQQDRSYRKCVFKKLRSSASSRSCRNKSRKEGMKEPFLLQFITYNSDCLPPLAWFSWWETNEKCDFDLETRRAHLITMFTCERIGHFANWACCVVCEVHFYTSSIFTAALECDARLRICEKTQKNVRDWKEEANSRCMLLMSSSSREIGVDRQQFAFIQHGALLFNFSIFLGWVRNKNHLVHHVQVKIGVIKMYRVRLQIWTQEMEQRAQWSAPAWAACCPLCSISCVQIWRRTR